MLTHKELSHFKSNYFSNFSYKKGTVKIRSKNTGHWWKFHWVELPIQNMFRLYHKYPTQSHYHVQCHRRRASTILKYIKDHDQYILNKRILK